MNSFLTSADPPVRPILTLWPVWLCCLLGSPAMTPEDFLSNIRRFATPSVCIPNEEETTWCRHAFVVTSHLRRKMREILAAHPFAPVMFAYLSDGWGSTTTTRYTAKVSNRVFRNARFRHEYLLQLGLLKVGSPGGILPAIVVDGAVSLKHGKRAWQCFRAGCDFMPLMRDMGCQGIISTFYIFDGLLKRPLTRHFTSRHRLYYTEYGPAGNSQDPLPALTDWGWSIKCASHTMTNAVKIGLRELCNEPLIDAVHIMIEALRNSADALHSHIAVFLLKNVDFSVERSGGQGDREALWRSLGVEHAWIDEFVFVDPVWRDGRLIVNQDLICQVDGMGRVSALLTYSYHWVKFSETRWAGIGKAGRLFFVSLLLGLEGAIDNCEADEHCSFFHLFGYGPRASEVAKLYLAVAALASYPGETGTLDLLEDDRLFIYADQYSLHMREEFAYLMALPMHVWERLSSVVGPSASAESLRSDVLRAASTCMGYAHREVFGQLESYPQKLTQGDISSRLEELASAGEVVDFLARQVQTLLKVGFPRNQLTDALRVAREAPCSTNMVEQLHGSGAAIMRVHKEYGERSLRMRQALHQCKRLIDLDPTERGLKRLRDELAKLQTAPEPRIHGRHAFVRSLSRDASASEEPQDRWDKCTDVFREHGRLYAAIPKEERSRFEDMAKKMTLAKKQAIKDRIEEIGCELELALSQQENEKRVIGVPNHMKSCKFTEREMWSKCVALTTRSRRILPS